MRLSIKSSASATRYYAIQTIYISGHKNTSKVVRKFGTHEELLLQNLDGLTPEQWCRTEIAKMNEEEAKGKRFLALDANERLALGEQTAIHCGHFFLKPLFNALGLDKFCKQISKAYKFEYDLSEILSMLVFTRVLTPSSKKASLAHYQSFFKTGNIQEHQVYRALDVLAEHSDAIQAELYKNSKNMVDRQSSILYYDCTNFFFEIDKNDGFRQYGISKQNQPSPLVQMGLFTDGNGIPLAFNLQPGNCNEQITLLPLEKKILKDFDCSQFIVCTDAGLSSQENRSFNTKGNRAFITTQSVKQLKKHLRTWALDSSDWHLEGSDKTFRLEDLDEEKDFEKVFYKERWINEKNFSQRLLVSYSLKYRNYTRKLRQGQIDRAIAAMQSGQAKRKKSNPNDYRRFINTLASTADGELAENTKYVLDDNQIQKEALYDGFYAVCTNLEGDVSQILGVNKRRWQIESCFRVMKSDFESRPVYLQKDNRILAHFLNCFIALTLVRILEQTLKEQNEHYSTSEVLKTLSNMQLTRIGKEYVPHFTRTPLTDKLHEIFGFNLDARIMSESQLQSLLKKKFSYVVQKKDKS
ncbi:MAG: IS1634 family transposase [Gallicola sp.]|nr:IS1634 family transposase [Gallicola sp.]